MGIQVDDEGLLVVQVRVLTLSTTAASLVYKEHCGGCLLTTLADIVKPVLRCVGILCLPGRTTGTRPERVGSNCEAQHAVKMYEAHGHAAQLLFFRLDRVRVIPYERTNKLVSLESSPL